MREMKDTGVVWCPTIPKEWHIEKVKNYFYISKDLATETNPTVLKLARSGICVKDVTTNEGQMAESYDNYNKVKAGDLLLNPMDLYSGANCNVSEIEGVISPAYTNLRLKASANSKFYNYYFKTQYWAMAMFAHGKGVSYDNRWTINAEGVKNYEIPVPSIEEQNAIVESIQRDTAKVDALIANQEAQIEKLKAYKQSLITEVVTKGLDPNVPMKDSGVEWIGLIPKHWNTIATKYLFRIESGATPKSENPEYFDGDIPWITPADYKTEEVFVFGGRRNISELGLKSCSTTLIPKGNLIFSKRAPIGAVAINAEELCTNQGCLSCIPKTEDIVKYYYYVMSVCTEQYNLLGSGTTFKEISATNFANFVLPNPSVSEQEEMVAYLDEKCSKVDRLIAIKNAKIEKLSQYKKSLIYEYVTGKKEVI